MGKVLSQDAVTKQSEKFHWDELTQTFVVETRQDVSECVELTQAEFNEYGKQAPWKGDLHRVARIPLDVVAELQRKGIWQDDDALKRWIDDRNNLKFKTRPGRLA